MRVFGQWFLGGLFDFRFLFCYSPFIISHLICRKSDALSNALYFLKFEPDRNELEARVGWLGSIILTALLGSPSGRRQFWFWAPAKTFRRRAKRTFIGANLGELRKISTKVLLISVVISTQGEQGTDGSLSVEVESEAETETEAEAREASEEPKRIPNPFWEKSLGSLNWLHFELVLKVHCN